MYMYFYMYMYVYMYMYLYMYRLCFSMYMYIFMCMYMNMNMYMYAYLQMYLYMAAAQKHRACNSLGRPFCDKACNKTGGLATSPPCDKPIEDRRLYTEARDKGLQERARDKCLCSNRVGDRDNPLF